MSPLIDPSNPAIVLHDPIPYDPERWDRRYVRAFGPDLNPLPRADLGTGDIVYDVINANTVTNNGSGIWGSWYSNAATFNAALDLGAGKYGGTGEQLLANTSFDDPYIGHGGLFGQAWIYDMLIKADQATNPSATMRVGMGYAAYGDLILATFNAGNYNNPMGILYARLSDGAWFLRMARGDGTAHTEVQLQGVAPFVAGANAPYYHLRLERTPDQTLAMVSLAGDRPRLGARILRALVPGAFPNLATVGGDAGLKWLAHSGTNGSKLDSKYWNQYSETFR